MNMRMMHRVWIVVVGWLLLAASPLFAVEPAEMAPADAGGFIQIDGLKAWRAEMAKDELYKLLADPIVKLRRQEPMALLEGALGQTFEQILDTYFGQRVVIIGQQFGPGQPSVMFTQINPDDAQFVRQRLELTSVEKIGSYEIFTNKDGNLRLGFHDQWMAIAGPENFDYLRRVLGMKATDPTLAQDATFKKWMEYLPRERSVTMFARQAERQEYNALALSRKDKDITLFYTGQTDGWSRMLDQTGTGGPLSLLPLPASTLAVADVHLLGKEPADTRMLDRLLSNAKQKKTFSDDIFPKLGSQVVIFLGAIPGKDLQMDPGLTYPVVGMAIKLKNQQVTGDLDRIFDGLLLLANVQTVRWGTDPINLSDATYKGTSYRLADLGQPLAQRTERNELANMKLAYGRVGNWYLLTSQDKFFNLCIDQAANPANATIFPSFAKVIDPAANKGLVGHLAVRTQPLANLLQSWIDYWKAAQPPPETPETPEAQKAQKAQKTPETPETPETPNTPATQATKSPAPDARFIQGLSIASQVLRQHQTITLDLRHAEEERITVQMNLVRAKPEEKK